MKLIRERLQTSMSVSIFAALSAFVVYSCMYAFRKPFTAATFGDMDWWGIDFKVWLILAQTVGYTLSKFYGIRFIAELNPTRRSLYVLLLIGMAWLALLGFALTPAPFNILFMLLNGFPLGMIWGIVFSYLEGRKTTELMGAFLSISFIVSSGFVKTVGKWLMTSLEVSPFWMPFLVGLLFCPLLYASLWCLDQVPPPTPEDERLRTRRIPMDRPRRKAFIKTFLPGILLLVVTYICLTILRDFRDNFAAELWKSLGYAQNPGIFTFTELPIALIVLLMMGLLVFVRNNYQAFMLNHGMILTGIVLLFGATVLFRQNMISPVLWMILTGTGLYLGYIPFNCLVFERLIATFKHPGNVGFVMYIADSFGYLGSVGILFYKELWVSEQLSWLRFYTQCIWVIGLLSFCLILCSLFYFSVKYKKSKTASLQYA